MITEDEVDELFTPVDDDAEDGNDAEDGVDELSTPRRRLMMPKMRVDELSHPVDGRCRMRWMSFHPVDDDAEDEVDELSHPVDDDAEDEVDELSP
ncbi:hypothetical protein AVEN_115244-1 [Araneus ventricosus]|uniref:Uncharacterized protein n=1 Tax=Araneus ventricosus TaxID=182803 RepID=A0A4Y1ZYL0_ARAVE|nr:hypothetical protein AVEN_115244-1 [Araneus ventricosus]